MSSSSHSVREEILVAADFCEELGESTYASIARDFANFPSTGVQYPYAIPSVLASDDEDIDVEIDWIDVEWVDQFVMSLEAFRNLHPLEQFETQIEAEMDLPYSFKVLRHFLSRESVDQLLDTQGFLFAASAIRNLRHRLGSVINTFVFQLILRRQISIAQAIDTLNNAEDCPKETSRLLIRLGYTTEEEVAIALSKFHNIEFIDPAVMTEVGDNVAQLLSEAVCRDYNIAPIRREGDTIVVASANPFDLDLASRLEFIFNTRIRLVIATASSILLRTYRIFNDRLGGYTSDSIAFENNYIDIILPENIPSNRVELINETNPAPARMMVEPETESLMGQFRKIWSLIRD